MKVPLSILVVNAASQIITCFLFLKLNCDCIVYNLIASSSIYYDLPLPPPRTLRR